MEAYRDIILLRMSRVAGRSTDLPYTFDNVQARFYATSLRASNRMVHQMYQDLLMTLKKV